VLPTTVNHYDRGLAAIGSLTKLVIKYPSARVGFAKPGVLKAIVRFVALWPKNPSRRVISGQGVALLFLLSSYRDVNSYRSEGVVPAILEYLLFPEAATWVLRIIGAMCAADTSEIAYVKGLGVLPKLRTGLEKFRTWWSDQTAPSRCLSTWRALQLAQRSAGRTTFHLLISK